MRKKDYLNSVLHKLPNAPGVYIMKDESADVIYIGKALSLKKRVGSYFNRSIQDPKVLAMISNISDIEYIVTNNEAEALILENNLIKRKQPFYNILLRDDKSFPFIKVTRDDFPKVIKTRNKLDKDGLFFGPYTDINHLNNYLRDINEFFKLRDCNRNIYRSIENKERPCLNYHIGICSAPCAGKISKEDYNRDVEYAIDFLKGNHAKVRSIYKDKMAKASSELKFEEAAIYRDRLLYLETMKENQNISIKKFKNRQDYISFVSDGNTAMFVILKYEEGNFIARENLPLDMKIDHIEDFIPSFILQYYSDNTFLPKEIYIDVEFEAMDSLESALEEETGRKIKISNPKIGRKKEILELAKKNAYEEMRLKDLRKDRTENYLSKAKKELELLTGLENIRNIESYDISNISGQNSVGVKVSYKDGKKSKSDYRRYKVNQSGKNDDYASMAEIIGRRIKRDDYPDLILVDGGRGHVSTVEKVLQENNIRIPVFGIYKDDKHQTKGLADAKQNYEINQRSSLYRFLTEIQNEVHRYAISYHRTSRNKSMIQSDLDNIKGIGEKRKMALLRRFSSIEGIKKASFDELISVEGMNRAAAEAIITHFKEKKNV